MITVYIASRDNDAGMEAADRLRALGYAPFWPIGSHFECVLFPLSDEHVMRREGEFLKQCDVLLRLEVLISGADREVALAKSLNIPVFYSIESLVENLPADGKIVLGFTEQCNDNRHAWVWLADNVLDDSDPPDDLKCRCGLVAWKDRQRRTDESRNAQMATGKEMLYGTIANPDPRPSFWRDPLGWLKWRPEVVWTHGEKITAEDWNRMIESMTMPSPGIHPPASPNGGKTD